MQPVLVPTTDVNSDTGILTHWHVADGGAVAAGDLLLEIETSKALIEVTSPGDGLVAHLAGEGDERSLSEPVALLLTDADELAAHRRRTAATAATRPTDGAFASAKAVARADALGVDLASLSQDGLITVADVERAARDRAPDRAPTPSVPARTIRPLAARPGTARLLVLGAGGGAAIVLDVVSTSPSLTAVGLLDDDPERLGDLVGGVPVVGGFGHVGALAATGGFDAAVIPTTAPATVRAAWRAACLAAGLPLANVVDPSARIAADVEMGQGNVIGAHCFLGTGTRLGDNNFLSAGTSFDHHNRVGTGVMTGPGCRTSGGVTVGDGVVLGTGVFVEPGLTLGDGVQVASGAVVLASVPAHHAVKTRTFTTVTVPLPGAARPTSRS